MPDTFPLRPDATWYNHLIARYGDAVPPIEHLQFRRGLQVIVDDLLHDLDIADRFCASRVYGITTRNAGFVVIDIRYSDGATEADRRMCNRIVERAQERLCEACEHCGRPGEIIAKTGLEALFDDLNAVLGDRFLCTECHQNCSGR
ncbi:hypothetical protein EGT36_30210 [Agrobacterium sp. FDAARGOS_525]|uniref:hypothetical protein n=1 Tax=Agrobacterium sp. FDAARGOS_525 TaxID=2420311 RepID=UPI000F66FBBD|nr:hypothetical protein [Agrobacterium sp. FDAARGOS_525]RSC21464.1 hypothetical protein EGT36_30210 [Agrobacterium sp. FDAARGOS_525]